MRKYLYAAIIIALLPACKAQQLAFKPGDTVQIKTALHRPAKFVIVSQNSTGYNVLDLRTNKYVQLKGINLQPAR